MRKRGTRQIFLRIPMVRATSLKTWKHEKGTRGSMRLDHARIRISVI